MVQKAPDTASVALPMLSERPARPERGDAAANRQRILCAAERLLTEQGAQSLTMQAVADAAGVGKTTVFHRFGDRDGLTDALLDNYMRELQDGFLHGPPPLGPGAPPRERLEAFLVEVVRCHAEHLEIAVAAEGAPNRPLPAAYGAALLHIATLVHDIDPSLDERILAGFIMNAVSPPVLARMRDTLAVDIPALQRGVRALLRGLV